MCIEQLSSLDDWANCAMSDCENKACLSLDSELCYPHTRQRDFMSSGYSREAAWLMAMEEVRQNRAKNR